MKGLSYLVVKDATEMFSIRENICLPRQVGSSRINYPSFNIRALVKFICPLCSYPDKCTEDCFPLQSPVLLNVSSLRHTCLAMSADWEPILFHRTCNWIIGSALHRGRLHLDNIVNNRGWQNLTLTVGSFATIIHSVLWDICGQISCMKNPHAATCCLPVHASDTSDDTTSWYVIIVKFVAC